MDLTDLPAGTVPPHIMESIANDLAVEFRNEAASRRSSVARGAETAELAATLLDKYGCALVKAARIAGVPCELQPEVDEAVRELDPEFNEHRKLRWAARPATIGTAN